MSRARRATTAALVAIAALLVAWDLWYPVHHDPRAFDPVAVGRLESEMWRAYYERRPWRLEWLLARMLREHYGFPWLRSVAGALDAARAARTFQKGHSREEWAAALPPLEAYYRRIIAASGLAADAPSVARLELEWWILRREVRPPPPDRLARAIAETAAALYGGKAEAYLEFAALRAEAMILRDEQAYGSGMLDDHWRELTDRLVLAYRALLRELHPGTRL